MLKGDKMATEEKSTCLSETFLKPRSILGEPFWPERIKVVSVKRIVANLEICGLRAKNGQFCPRFLTQNYLLRVELRA